MGLFKKLFGKENNTQSEVQAEIQASAPAPEPVKDKTSEIEWGECPEGADGFERALWTAIDKALKKEVNELHIMKNTHEWNNYHFNAETSQWESSMTTEQWDEYDKIENKDKEIPSGSSEKFIEDIEEIQKKLKNNTAHYLYAAVSAHETGSYVKSDNIGLIYRNTEQLQASPSVIKDRIAISENVRKRNMISTDSLPNAIWKAAEKIEVLPLLTSVSIFSREAREDVPDISFNEYNYYGSDGHKNGVIEINIDAVVDRGIDIYKEGGKTGQEAFDEAFMEHICFKMFAYREKDIYSDHRKMYKEDADKIASEIAGTQVFKNSPIFKENIVNEIISERVGVIPPNPEIVGDDAVVGDGDENPTRDERSHIILDNMTKPQGTESYEFAVEIYDSKTNTFFNQIEVYQNLDDAFEYIDNNPIIDEDLKYNITSIYYDKECNEIGMETFDISSELEKEIEKEDFEPER